MEKHADTLKRQILAQKATIQELGKDLLLHTISIMSQIDTMGPRPRWDDLAAGAMALYDMFGAGQRAALTEESAVVLNQPPRLHQKVQLAMAIVKEKFDTNKPWVMAHPQGQQRPFWKQVDSDFTPVRGQVGSAWMDFLRNVRQ
ncbi:hypothetical protein LQW54_008107 [Pestalotiopsis sp. IQ-011]